MTNEELVSAIQDGRNEKEYTLQLWEQNKGLIVKAAVRYSHCAELEDLLQQGFLGLLDAVRTYDHDKGAAFATHAMHWIRQSMTRYIEDSCRIVRIPSVMSQTVYRYQKTIKEYQLQNGRDPTQGELCTLLNISLDKLERIEAAARIEQVDSLDALESNAEGNVRSLGETIAGESDVESEVIDSIYQEELARIVWQCVEDLPERERQIIQGHYRDGASLSTIARDLGITPQYCAARHEEALKRLKRKRELLAHKALAAAWNGTSLSSFQKTRTSATERAALLLYQLNEEKNH